MGQQCCAPPKDEIDDVKGDDDRDDHDCHFCSMTATENDEMIFRVNRLVCPGEPPR